jgi:TatA/E family protein of Tat protein translocase
VLCGEAGQSLKNGKTAAVCTDPARSSSNTEEEFMFEGIFQPTHLLLIFGVALLVFGPKKLPELGKGIGAGIRALKEGIKDPLIEPGKSGSAGPIASNDSNSN